LVFQVKLFATLARGNAASFYVNLEQACFNTIYASGHKKMIFAGY